MVSFISFLSPHVVGILQRERRSMLVVGIDNAVATACFRSFSIVFPNVDQAAKPREGQRSTMGLLLCFCTVRVFDLSGIGCMIQAVWFSSKPLIQVAESGGHFLSRIKRTLRSNFTGWSHKEFFTFICEIDFDFLTLKLSFRGFSLLETGDAISPSIQVVL